MRHRGLIAGGIAAALFSGCVAAPLPEPSVPDAPSQPAGPVVGDGERTLLQDYEALLQERKALDERVVALEAARDKERDRADRAGRDLDAERQIRTAAELENRRLGERVRDLESKAVALAIRNAELEKEFLQARIEGLEAELAGRLGAVHDHLGSPAGPPEGGR